MMRCATQFSVIRTYRLSSRQFIRILKPSEMKA